MLESVLLFHKEKIMVGYVHFELLFTDFFIHFVPVVPSVSSSLWGFLSWCYDSEEYKIDSNALASKLLQCSAIVGLSSSSFL